MTSYTNNAHSNKICSNNSQKHTKEWFMDNADLNYIKKHYGENFAKLCRGLFSTILETPGFLSKIISERFDPSPTLYEDILPVKDDFKTYIYSFYLSAVKAKSAEPTKTAEQLLDEAGYILYPECKTEKDIQYFKKYYKKGEAICTFNGGRLESCRVWFAVKKNADNIRRKDFINPQRQDEYGTSVISIQFTKGLNSTLSIKNRYNHMVDNPDATFGNNLDNIIPGLTDAFCSEYNIDLISDYRHKFEIKNYTTTYDGKFYKINVKDADQTAYCANNAIIDRYGKLKTYDKSKYLLIENYLIDLVNKKIKNLVKYRDDGFVQSIGKIKTIHISLDQNKNRVINITPFTGEDVKIVVDKSNQIIEYANKNIKHVDDGFLLWNRYIKKLSLPNLETAGYNFMYGNECLEDLDMPNLKSIRHYAFLNNKSLKEINFPKLESVGSFFFNENNAITKLDLPKLEEVGTHFFVKNKVITEVNMPNLKTVDNNFLHHNKEIQKLSLPNLESTGRCFLSNNKILSELNLPNLQSVGESFLYENEGLTKLDLPNLRVTSNNFLYDNTSIRELNLPNIKTVGDCFLRNNHCLEKISLPNLVSVGDAFFSNSNLTEVNMPKLESAREDFLRHNNKLKELSLPNLKVADRNFMSSNTSLSRINFPNLKVVGSFFLFDNQPLLRTTKILKRVKTATTRAEIEKEMLGDKKSDEEDFTIPSV